MDKIFFIKHGECEMTKQVEVSNSKKKEKVLEGPNIDIKQYRQFKNMNTFNKRYMTSK